MPRNLIICCDGTANEFERDRTNVLKLAYAADKDSTSQILFYHPGVGTMAPPGVFTRFGQKIVQLAGLAFGYGLKSDIRDAYTFIIDHYQPGDTVFIFGFSRGAYTARAVIALVAQYGLLSPGNAGLVPYAIRLLWKFHRSEGAAKNECFQLAADFKKTLSIGDCHIRFAGIWDTVSSVGWIANPLSLPNTQRLPGVDVIRHAVSIDERRAFFRTNLVAPDASRDIQEVWFPGDHCDVGGGHPEAVSGQSKFTLKWIIDEAEIAGMRFDAGRVKDVLGGGAGEYVPPDPTTPLHNQMWPYWWPAEFVFKKHWDMATGKTRWRPNLFRRRHFSPRPVIDDSAWARGEDYTKRLPADAVKKSESEL